MRDYQIVLSDLPSGTLNIVTQLPDLPKPPAPPPRNSYGYDRAKWKKTRVQLYSDEFCLTELHQRIRDCVPNHIHDQDVFITKDWDDEVSQWYVEYWEIKSESDLVAEQKREQDALNQEQERELALLASLKAKYAGR